MVQEEPNLAEKFWGKFWDPGGDPEAIDQVSDLLHQRANDLRASSEMLAPATTRLLASWTQGEDRDGYEVVSKRLLEGIRDEARFFNSVADDLAAIAEEIRDAHRAADIAKIAVVAAAVIAAAALVATGGASVVAGAAVAVTARIALLQIMARLSAALASRVGSMAATAGSWKALGEAMLMGATVSWLSSVGVVTLGENSLAPWKWEIDKFDNPLDLDNWSANDWTNLVIGGLVTTGMVRISMIARETGWINRTVGTGLRRRLMADGLAAGPVGGSIGSFIMQFVVQGEPLDSKEAWGNVLLSAAVASGSGLAVGTASVALSRVRPSTVRAPGMGMTHGDIGRALTGLPAGAAWYWINTRKGEAPPPMLSAAAPEAPVAPALPRPVDPVDMQRPAPPPGAEIQHGDSLWAIAERVYGEGNGDQYRRIAEANGLDPDAIIHPHQHLVIPPLPIRAVPAS